MALETLEPALLPIIKKSVFLLIDDKILAPLVLAKYFASSLEREFSVPVNTKYLLVKKLFKNLFFTFK